MIICGIKITHDGSVALIKDNKLVFCVELEKIKNNARYNKIDELNDIAGILEMHGYSTDDVDQFVIDGWHPSIGMLYGSSFVKAKTDSRDISIEVAGYHEVSLKDDLLKRHHFPSGLVIGGKDYPYSSYVHGAGHVMSAYSTSHFARQKESSYILVWDGGQYPRLYFYDARNHKLENRGHIFCLLGTAYSIIGQYFGPYKKTQEQMNLEAGSENRDNDFEGYFGGYSVAGKIMSYIALGEVKNDLLRKMAHIHKTQLEICNTFEHKFCREIVKEVSGKGFKDADVLRTFHAYIEQLLVDSLRERLHRDDTLGKHNFCFVGGCALNIKWNSAIRNSGMFKDVFVTPVPNDSGSALGAACCEMLYQTRDPALNWTVYQGANIRLGDNVPLPGWDETQCSVRGLAELLHDTNEPVVVLNGCAELGPRALGNRSIIAPAIRKEMKTILNHIKKREEFRPVAPICLEAESEEIFSPGGRDPYMLFDHHVDQSWKERIPAVCHLDGTARLQTVNANDNPTIFELLTHYKSLTGIPLLCNTSANFNGSGFFPDVKSAMEWGRINYIWSDNRLFHRKEMIDLDAALQPA